LNEGTPVSIIEAMASGKPVLTTRVGGVEDFITHGINGMTADLSVADFSNKLIKLIKDSELCDIIGKKARVSVLERFGYTRLVSDMDTLYKYLKLK
jgi:glycosyltransferase involved in cell wall biosynthesis